MTTATQDVQDFLSTDYGKAILSNSSIQMLLKQSPSEVDLVAQTFYLSQGEKELLLSADIGEGLFFAGQSHVAMKVIAAPFEHTMITSNPQEILKMQELKEQEAQLLAQAPTEPPVIPPAEPFVPPTDQTTPPGENPVPQPNILDKQ